MTSLELIGLLTFIVIFALLISFLSWDSQNDNSFGSELFFTLDDDNNIATMSVFIAICLIAFFIF